MANTIHPTVVIEGDVQLGDGNEIGPYTVLIGPLTIGDDNWIGPHVVIGTPGEDTKDPRHDSSNNPIRVGSRNIIREFTVIQKPCYGSLTSIADDVFLMHGVHIPHDAHLEDGVTVTPLCVVGGIVTILENATIGMGAQVHQYSVVGQYSMTAAGATVMKNVRPFSRYIPNRPTSVNQYAIKKYGFSDVESEIEKYVLEGVAPTDERLLDIVRHYDELHSKSGRQQY